MAVKRLLQSLLVQEVADEAHRSPQHEHSVEAAVCDEFIRLQNERKIVHARCSCLDYATDAAMITRKKGHSSKRCQERKVVTFQRFVNAPRVDESSPLPE